MDIRYRFTIRTPFILEDCWPIESRHAVIEFERSDDIATALLVTFRNQPIQLAPKVRQPADGSTSTSILLSYGFDDAARSIASRFRDYINLYFSIEIVVDELDVQFIPADDTEDKQIPIKRFQRSIDPEPAKIRFSVLAQSILAGEQDGDPSYASHMLRSARASFFEHRFIDSFRYSFLFFEALYGDGQFKQRDLIRAFLKSHDFIQLFIETQNAFRSDPLYLDPMLKNSEGAVFASKQESPTAFFEHIVEMRGFYFHGNLARRNAWRPERQEPAKGLAEFCIDLLGRIASRFADEMYGGGIADRMLENAKKQGAMLTIDVRYEFINEHQIISKGHVAMRHPGNLVTGLLCFVVSKNFIEWYENRHPAVPLVSASAIHRETGAQVFNFQYFHQDIDGAVRPLE